MRAVDPQVVLCRRWAEFYLSLGINVLPSRSDAKRPVFHRYGHLRDHGLPAWVLDRWAARNCQVCTGCRWRLAVVDLDGPGALARWAEWTRFLPAPPTWTSATDPARGRHLWFAVPAGVDTLSSRWLWRGDAAHEGIELLADRGLVMAPPSRRPFEEKCPERAGQPYRFLVGYSPWSIARPAELPWWVAQLGRVIQPPDPAQMFEQRNYPPTPDPTRLGCYIDHRRVLAAIPDKVGLAQSWRLRFAADHPNGAGWYRVHAVGREDRTPSASFHGVAGRYCELGPAGRVTRSLSLFNLGVELGVFPDFPGALRTLAARYGVPPERNRR